MLYPPMSKLLQNVNNRYYLVNVIAHRARQISSEAEAMGITLEDKPVSMAINEVAEGKVRAHLKECEDQNNVQH